MKKLQFFKSPYWKYHFAKYHSMFVSLFAIGGVSRHGCQMTILRDRIKPRYNPQQESATIENLQKLVRGLDEGTAGLG